MFLSKIFILLIGSVFFSFSSSNLVSEPTGKARISLVQNENMLQIKGYFLNASNSTQDLSYKLYTVKKGKSGSSRNAQGGQFKVEAGEETVLAQTRISLAPRDNYSIKLLVFREGELVSQDSVIYSGNNQSRSEY